MNAGVRQRGGAFGDVPFEASTPANPHPFGPGPSPNASVLGTSMAVGGQQGSKSGDTPSFERHASVLPAIYPAETLITVHEEHGELIAVPEAQARRDEYIKVSGLKRCHLSLSAGCEVPPTGFVPLLGRNSMHKAPYA